MAHAREGNKGRTVAIVPARGGSQRIPSKNIATLAGKPLLAYTIEAALAARGIDEVHVSTDDLRVAAAAVSFGASVIERPAELATAEASTEPALIHAVETLEAHGDRVDVVVMLQPTSPLRTAAHVERAVALQADTGCDAVVAVVAEVGYYFLGDIDDQGRLSVGYDPQRRLRTQDIAPRYRENGALYVTRRDHLMQSGCRMGGDMRPLVMDEISSIDIDTPVDLQRCEAVLSARRRRTGRGRVLDAGRPHRVAA